MKRIIYLLPVAALFMGVQSCCCDKDDDNDSAPVAAPAIQPNGDLAVDLGLSVKWATCVNSKNLFYLKEMAYLVFGITF